MLSQKLVNLCGWNRVNSPKSIFSSFKSNLSCGPEVFLLMLLQNLSGKTSRLQKNQSEAQAANEEFVLRNHTFSSPQIVQYSAPSHPATFGQFAPFCSGMRSRKTSLKHRFRIRSGNRKRRFSPWKKWSDAMRSIKQWKKYIWYFQTKDSWGDGYTIKFKHCFRKFSTRKWRSLAQSSKMCWECHLHSSFLGVFWGISLVSGLLPSVNFKEIRSWRAEKFPQTLGCRERLWPCHTRVIYV